MILDHHHLITITIEMIIIIKVNNNIGLLVDLRVVGVEEDRDLIIMIAEGEIFGVEEEEVEGVACMEEGPLKEDKEISSVQPAGN